MADKPPAFTQRHTVGFHETDAAGFAHFTNILRWMEAAEHALLRERGVPVLGKKSGWPRAGVCVQFQSPLRFGDEIETRVWMRVRNATRINFYFQVWRVGGAGAPQRCASGEFTTVHVVRAGRSGKIKSAPLSAAMLKKLR